MFHRFKAVYTLSACLQYSHFVQISAKQFSLKNTNYLIESWYSSILTYAFILLDEILSGRAQVEVRTCQSLSSEWRSLPLAHKTQLPFVL